MRLPESVAECRHGLARTVYRDRLNDNRSWIESVAESSDVIQLRLKRASMFGRLAIAASTRFQDTLKQGEVALIGRVVLPRDLAAVPSWWRKSDRQDAIAFLCHFKAAH